MKPLTVIQSAPVWLPQTQTWMYQQVRHLPPETETHVVCERTLHLDQFNLPNIHCLYDESRLRYLWDKGLRKLRLRPYLGYLVDYARQLRADIVHAHFADGGWLNRGVKWKTDAAFVVTFYGYDVNRLPLKSPVWRERYAELFALVDRVLCEGSFMARSVVALGCPEEKVQVHHLGVIVEDLPFRTRQWEPGQPLKVLMAASFTEKKGFPYGLSALGRLASEVPLEITIIGDARPNPRDQHEKEQIVQTIQAAGLESCVRLLGYQPYDILLEEAYQHHIFLAPSVTAANGDTEGGAPVSIIEMMATGMPVVSSRHCDIPEIVHHMETGLLAEERDVDGLERQLHWLLENHTRWAALAEAGQKHVEKHYNAKLQGEKLAGLYRELY